MLRTGDLLADLGFVLAVDNCARGCLHCPAYGSRVPVARARLDELEARLAGLAEVSARLGIAAPTRVVHCWRISDPLDYWSRLAGGGIATCADVATLWRRHLGQGLYVVTNGSEGRMPARRAVTTIAGAPHLVSQIKLTVTPYDRNWGTARYADELVADIRELMPLWDLPSERKEDPSGLRFRVNVKTAPERVDELRCFVHEVFQRCGLSRRAADEACADPTRVAMKPIYDLGSASGDSPVAGAFDVRDTTGTRNKPTTEVRARCQYGIRPDGRLFEVDMYAFTERNLRDPNGRYLCWPLADAHDAAIPTGSVSGAG